VTNTGGAGTTYTLVAVCTGTAIASGCSATPTSLFLNMGANGPATVNFTTGAAGTTGTVTLQARVNGVTLDAGSYNVTVSPGPPPGQVAPVVDVGSVNPGAVVARGQCLTLAIASAAASECGDLRIVHSLPSVRTMNTPRTPTLIYNSAHAVGWVSAGANVTLPSGAQVPTTVTAALKIGGVTRATGSWPGNQWTAGAIRRIALGFKGPAASLGTGVHDYVLEVTNVYSGGGSPAATATGKLVIVDRSTSYFGAGWWLAGLEEWNPSTTVWIGGDGSARQYVLRAGSVAPNRVWGAPAVTYPDSIREIGTEFVRQLPDSVWVYFNAQGKHVRTRNRQGHVTVFAYNANSKLSTITLPPAASPLVYQVNYSGNGKVSTIWAPGAPSTRVTSLTIHSATGRLTSILEADGRAVSFGYGTDHKATSRTDRRLTVTNFQYDAGGRVRQAAIKLQPDSSTQTLTNASSQGFSGVSVPLAQVFTRLDGPRTDVPDVTTFWLNRLGAPDSILNALAHRSLLVRGDPVFVGAVTQLTNANGHTVASVYDGRGNLVSTTAINPLNDGQNAVTRYHWHGKWDAVDSIITAAGVVTTMAYSSSTGNRIWQQVGSDPARRVTFRYGNALNLVSSTVQPSTLPDSLEYDARGNLRATRTPRGFWTTLHKDAIGRDTAIVSPVDSMQTASLLQRERFNYDVMGRIRWTETIGAAMNGAPAQTSRVETDYDEEGNPKVVTRRLTPTDGIAPLVTQWFYDRAGNTVKEIAPDGQADSTVYDHAGNPIKALTRRGQQIFMVYDTLNRLSERRMPPVFIPQWSNAGIPVSMANRSELGAFIGPFPMFGTGTGYQIPADTMRFTYDALGNTLTANNRDARVTRTYYNNSLLKTETQQIRTLAEIPAGGSFNSHVHTLTYKYDKDGRRIELQHPSNLAPMVGGVLKDRTSYLYYSFGELERVTDLLGHQYRYTYSLRTEQDSLYLPRGVKERFTYDQDGNLATYVVRNGAGALMRNLTMRYDGRGRLVRSLGLPDTLIVRHSGLGHVVSSNLVTHGFNQVGGTLDHTVNETFTNDALGNLRSMVSTATVVAQGASTITNRGQALTYLGQTSRLSKSESTIGPFVRDTTWFDQAGNTVFTYQSAFVSTATLQDRASFYDAEGRLRAADHRRYDEFQSFTKPYQWSFEEYRYDALGRRVWVRARRFCRNDEPLEAYAKMECNQSLIRRTVWDGEHELWEMQMPGEVGSAYLENDTVTVNVPRTSESLDPHPFYGRVAFTQGLAIDQPLGITRIGYVDFKFGTPRTVFQPFTVVPGWNLRGDPDRQYIAEPTVAVCTGSGTTPCVYVESPMRWHTYGAPGRLMDHWYGTVIENKVDKAGTHFRRNRYYDQGTGRFTQEDPIGLAGGLNLYGFANGDPVNFSDPFGLCVGPLAPVCVLVARIGIFAMRAAPVATELGVAASTGLTAGAAAGAAQGGAGAATTLGGRLGGAAHRARVAEVADEFIAAGGKIVAGGGRLPERAVEVGGGRIRFPDIIGEAADAARVFINVGRMTKGGVPVSREVRALDDLLRTGVPSIFIRYTNP
jgi:RHS repeat-associated protein